VHCYSSGHIHSVTICRAFAEGGGHQIVTMPAPLQPGAAFFYGQLRGLKPLLDEAIAEKREWYYADNGYFRPGHYHGYYRITRNAFQHDGSGAASAQRWERLGKPLLPWRRSGSGVLVCSPGATFASLHGFDSAQWVRETIATLKAHTDRPIVVREKPNKGQRGRGLLEELKDCHALVTHSSNSAVEALLFGVPVFCTAPCAASAMAEKDLTRVESPARPEGREQWAWNLAANQWTLTEMKNGIAWKELNNA
jgi:hypothetical protein